MGLSRNSVAEVRLRGRRKAGAGGPGTGVQNMGLLWDRQSCWSTGLTPKAHLQEDDVEPNVLQDRPMTGFLTWGLAWTTMIHDHFLNSRPGCAI